MALNVADAIEGGNIRLLKNSYSFRIIDVEFKYSAKTNNPMIQLTCELVKPETIKIGNEVFKCAGMKTSFFLVLIEKQLGRIKEFYRKLELPMGIINEEAPDLDIYRGLGFDAIAYSEEQKAKVENLDPDTGEVTEGNAILDHEGKPIKRYQLRLDTILRRNKEVESAGGVPY